MNLFTFCIETILEVIGTYESRSLQGLFKEWYSVEVKCTQSVIKAILPEDNDSKNLGF